LLDRAGEATLVRALAPRGSRELPAFASWEAIDGRIEAVRPYGLWGLCGV